MHVTKCVCSDVSSDVLGISFSAGDFRKGAQMHKIMVFEEEFPIISMYGWHGLGLFRMENVITMN